jgi:diaphanous 1
MADESPLLVPIVLPSGALHVVSVAQSATCQDTINELLARKDVKYDVLGDIEEQGWALQIVVKEQPGRPWEIEELEALGDSKISQEQVFPCTKYKSLELVEPNSKVAPLLESLDGKKPSSQSHFSAFPLTSHLHAPSLRLVSLHPSLSCVLDFRRVPEVHDEFYRKVFFSRQSTAENLVTHVVEELGLTKSLPVPGSGNLEYVIEEVWTDGSAESKLVSIKPIFI